MKLYKGGDTMETIENAVKKELEKNYKNEVKELIRKVRKEVEDEDLIPSNLGEELREFFMGKYSKENLESWLIRLGLDSLDWDLIGEDLYYEFEEEVI
jgi:hypothetical protein